MADTSASSKAKADARRQRNLASANASRQRRREQISSLSEEASRLNEANAILRARLRISDNGLPRHGQPGSSSGGAGSSRRSDMIELGPATQDLLGRKEMDPHAVVDLLDRTLSGSKGKGPPLDPAAAKRIADAARKMPRDVDRPLKYAGEKKESSSKSSSSRKR